MPEILPYIKEKMKKTLRSAGFVIRRTKYIPYGVDLMEDVKSLSKLIGVNIEVIFDVGANIGHTSLSFRNNFAQAKIYAFEPHPETHKRLTSRLAYSDVDSFQIAFGTEPGHADFFAYPHDVLNSLVRSAKHSNKYKDQCDTIKVPVETIDNFCAAHSIYKIDLLKIDVEGAELDVLNGAKETLERGRVRFVYFEFNDICENFLSYGGSLIDVGEYLSKFGFRFVATYTDAVVLRDEFSVVANCLMARP